MMDFHKVRNTIQIRYYYQDTMILHVSSTAKFHIHAVSIKIDAIGMTVYYCINISVEEPWRQKTGAIITPLKQYHNM